VPSPFLPAPPTPLLARVPLPLQATLSFSSTARVTLLAIPGLVLFVPLCLLGGTIYFNLCNRLFRRRPSIQRRVPFSSALLIFYSGILITIFSMSWFDIRDDAKVQEAETLMKAATSEPVDIYLL